MTREVWISICSWQTMDGECGPPIETKAAGAYYSRGEKHYILYEETDEDGGPIKSRIRIDGPCMDLFRDGTFSVHMRFEEGKRCEAAYRTPYGSFAVGIDTRRLHIEKEEEYIGIEAEYALGMNGTPVADCRLTMRVGVRAS